MDVHKKNPEKAGFGSYPDYKGKNGRIYVN
jgi:hypothetical protein